MDLNVENGMGRQPEHSILVNRSVSRASDMWEFMGHLKKDINTAVGKPAAHYGNVVSADTLEIGEAADIASLQINKIKDSMLAREKGKYILSPHPSSLKQYLSFFSELEVEGATGFGNKIRESLKDKGDLIPFFAKLVELNPLMGATTIILYDQASKQQLAREHKRLHNKKERKERPSISEWYKNSIDSLSEVYQHMGAFFTTLKGQVKRTRGSELTQEFLEAFHQDLQLNLVEVVNLATLLRLNVRGSSNSAILVSSIPALTNYVEKAREGILALAGPEVFEDGRVPFYRRYSQHLLENLQQMPLDKKMLYIPIVSSTVDVEKFGETYNAFWSNLNLSIQSKGDNRFHSTGIASLVELGNTALILLRPEIEKINGKNTQARVAIDGRGVFRGLDIRVDREEWSDPKGLGLDMGGGSFVQAIEYAKNIAEKDKAGELEERFSDIVKGDNRLSGQKRLVPSIMESEATYYDFHTNQLLPLSYSDKIGLFTSIVMQEGSEIGLRDSKYLRHHSRGHISQDPQYYEEFPTIVQDLKRAFVRG